MRMWKESPFLRIPQTLNWKKDGFKTRNKGDILVSTLFHFGIFSINQKPQVASKLPKRLAACLFGSITLFLISFTIHLQHYALHGHFLGSFKKLSNVHYLQEYGVQYIRRTSFFDNHFTGRRKSSNWTTKHLQSPAIYCLQNEIS